MKKNNNLLIASILILLMFISYSGSNMSMLHNSNYTGNVNSLSYNAALLNVLLNILFISILPFFILILNQEFYKKNKILIYIINGIVWLFLSVPVFSYLYDVSDFTIGGYGLWGTLIFSIINYNLISAIEKRYYSNNTCSTSKKVQNEEIKITNKVSSNNKAYLSNDSDILYIIICSIVIILLLLIIALK